MDQVKPFYYKGKISSSKSLYNRYLVAQSFYSDFQIHGSSTCDDVSKMKLALMKLKEKDVGPIDCGGAGTVLRFLMARISRRIGTHFLTGKKRLLERPHGALVEPLEKMNVKIHKKEDAFEVNSSGWQLQRYLPVDLTVSSQYASALLLSAWNLNEPLVLVLSENKNSFSYLKMTVDVLQELGMEVSQTGHQIRVEAGQELAKQEVYVEPDMSSCFSLAAFAAASGTLVIEDFPKISMQPDSQFTSILEAINVPCVREGGQIVVQQSADLRPLNYNLSDNPDLFPVLAILLGRAKGISKIEGIEHLAFKESDRLKKTEELLGKLKRKTALNKDCFIIHGEPSSYMADPFSFDPDQDHRMAMAAALANQMGAQIEIQNRDVVDKSFPEFWDIVGNA